MTWHWPWNDRAGRLSALKLATLAGAILPGLVLAWWLATGTAGAKPVTTAIHTTGDWAIRFLIISLAVTPLRRIAQWPKLHQVRRMLGLTALVYALIHLMSYVVEQAFDLGQVASEIVLRVYLLIGFVALVGLALLGATSTDAMIRRLGRNWNRLHAIVYPVAALGILHFFMQTKIDVWQPTLMAGFFMLLMACRIAPRAGFALSPLNLAILAALAVPATMAVEYLWYALATGVPAERVFLANFAFGVAIRPSWWVGLAGLGLAAIAFIRTPRKGAAAALKRQRA